MICENTEVSDDLDENGEVSDDLTEDRETNGDLAENTEHSKALVVTPPPPHLLNILR
jgi:hypothetical protein